MKKTFSIIVLFLFLLQFVCGCKGNDTPAASGSQSAVDMRTMTITMQLWKRVPLYDECEKQKTEPDEKNGWQIHVTVEGANGSTSYTLRDNILRINDDFYTVDAEALTDKITDIFNDIKE